MNTEESLKESIVYYIKFLQQVCSTRALENISSVTMKSGTLSPDDGVKMGQIENSVKTSVIYSEVHSALSKMLKLEEAR